MDAGQLKWLNASYKEVYGQVPKHFVCPILMKDEDVELCDGHVLNAALKSASRATVIQRKDVDNCLGSAIEPDLITFLNLGRTDIAELIRKKTKGQLKVKLPDGTVSEVFFAGPAAATKFQRIALTSPKDGKMIATPFLRTGKIDGPAKNMEMTYELFFHDNSLIGGMLKSAYLALFRAFGYRGVKDPGCERIRAALRACHLAGAEKDPNAKKTPFFKNFVGSVKVLSQHPFTKDTLNGNAFLMHSIPYRKDDILFGMSCLFKINDVMFVVTIPACTDSANVGRSYSYYCNYLKNPGMIHLCRATEFEDGAFFVEKTPFALSYKDK